MDKLNLRPQAAPVLLILVVFLLAATQFAKAASETLYNAGTVYAGTTDGVFKSTDQGVTWTASNNGFPSGTKILDLTLGPPPAPAIEFLIARIQELNLGADVPSILIPPLNAAKAAVYRGNPWTAHNRLRAFISQLSSLLNNDEIDPVVGKSLIILSDAIIDDSAIESRARRAGQRRPGSP